MPALGLDTVLNLLWLAIGLACLGVFVCFEFRRRSTLRGRLLRTLALLVVTVSLFPCVSLSDDEVSFSFLLSHFGQRGSTTPLEESKEKTMLHLARLLDMIDNCQISGFWSLVVTLFFLTFVYAVRQTRGERHLICASGRAPPLN